MMRHHRGAGPGGNHDRLTGLECLQEMARHGARSGAIAASVCGLPATRLVLGKVHPIAQPLQHVGHRHPHFGEKLIDHAGDEQRNLVAHVDSNCIRMGQTIEKPPAGPAFRPAGKLKHAPPFFPSQQTTQNDGLSYSSLKRTSASMPGLMAGSMLSNSTMIWWSLISRTTPGMAAFC